MAHNYCFVFFFLVWFGLFFYNTIEVRCPACVKGYNINMGGVDLSDQKRKTLSCSRKSIKWYMRLFWFVVDIMCSQCPHP